MDLEGINAGNWVDSAQDRSYWRALVNSAMELVSNEQFISRKYVNS